MKYLNFANHIQSNNQPETLLTMIDLSGSMLTDDIKPSRKDAAINANMEIIRVKKQHHSNDKVGIISFQSSAKFTLLPAYPAEIGDLQKIVDDNGLTGGTDFCEPLKLAYNYFSGRPAFFGKNAISKMLSCLLFAPAFEHPTIDENTNTVKRIILLTDGEHLGSGNPIDIADNLKSIGVIIDCIGIGGSPKNVDEELLKQIASRNPDGSVRYCFIGDKEQLLKKYRSLAYHIKAV